MGAFAPYSRLQRVQQKIFVRYYSVRAGVGYCGWRRRFVDTRRIDQMAAMERKALCPQVAVSACWPARAQ